MSNQFIQASDGSQKRDFSSKQKFRINPQLNAAAGFLLALCSSVVLVVSLSFVSWKWVLGYFILNAVSMGIFFFGYFIWRTYRKRHKPDNNFFLEDYR